MVNNSLKSEVIKNNVIKNVLKIINIPLYRLFGVDIKYKFSFGKSSSDVIAVINNYTKQLLLKKGVDEKKIIVVGSLHYDDALRMKRSTINDIKKKYDVVKSDINIVYFSQPFYKKDVNFILLEVQLNHLEVLVQKVDYFYKNKRKNYTMFIKLHPVENVNDYKKFFSFKNLKIINEANNNELILLSNFCIGHNSTVLQSVIVLNKPVISLNIIEEKFTRLYVKIGAKLVGINNCVDSWDEFVETLNILDNRNYIFFDNIKYDKVIRDGRSYNRIIELIEKMIKITVLRTSAKGLIR